MSKKSYFHSGEIRRKTPIETMRHYLKVSTDGLMLSCTIKLENQFSSSDNPIECEALIDTGSDITVLCKSIFDRFECDKSKLGKIGVHSLNSDQEDMIIYPFMINVPLSNWSPTGVKVMIADLTKREGYQAIIGMDLSLIHI